MGKVGILVIVLVIAMGTMGVAYSGWTAQIDYGLTVNTGTVVAQLSAGAGSSPEITIGNLDPQTLGVRVTHPQANTTYYATFSITNAGTIPVRVQGTTVTPVSPPTLPPQVTVSVQDMAGNPIKGLQVDPQSLRDGKVVFVSTHAFPSGTFQFNVTIQAVSWSLYKP